MTITGTAVRNKQALAVEQQGVPAKCGVALPGGEGITASYRDGMVEIVVSKAMHRAEPRQIPVSATDGKTVIPSSGHAA